MISVMTEIVMSSLSDRPRTVSDICDMLVADEKNCLCFQISVALSLLQDDGHAEQSGAQWTTARGRS